LIILDGVLWNR